MDGHRGDAITPRPNFVGREKKPISVIIYWLAKIWCRNSNHRHLLVWDSFWAHITPHVKEAVRSTFNSDMTMIPGGCTSKLQPADVS